MENDIIYAGIAFWILTHICKHITIFNFFFFKFLTYTINSIARSTHKITCFAIALLFCTFTLYCICAYKQPCNVFLKPKYSSQYTTIHTTNTTTHIQKFVQFEFFVCYNQLILEYVHKNPN